MAREARQTLRPLYADRPRSRRTRWGSIAVVVALGIGFVASVPSVGVDALALGRPARPSLTWKVTTLSPSARINPSTLVKTSSKGKKTWSVSGQCRFVRQRIRTNATGTCKVTLKIARTTKHAARTATKRMRIVAPTTSGDTVTTTTTTTIAPAVNPWAMRIGGSGIDRGVAVATMADGSSVVAGYFSGTMTVGSTPLASAGGNDVFVAKLSAAGSVEWIKSAGGASGADEPRAISLFPDGSAVLGGVFRDAADFGTYNLTTTGTDAFVAKISSSGQWQWAVRAGGSTNDEATGVAALADGSVFVSGNFTGAATFGGTTLNSAGGYDAFVGKVGAQGTWSWASRAGGTGFDTSSSISVHSDGTAVVGGYFSAAGTFGATTLNSAGDTDVFVAKVTAAGSWSWAAGGGGTGTDRGQSVAVLSDGSAVLVGYMTGNSTFGSTSLVGAGSVDAFVAKVSAAGAWTWATSGGGTGTDSAQAVSVNADGSLLVGGSFEATASFGSTSLTSAGSSDAMVSVVSASGTWNSAVRIGGSDFDSVAAVSTLSNGSALVVGAFSSTATAGSVTLTSAGGTDAFIGRMSSAGAFS